MKETAKRAALVTLVVIGLVAVSLALWKLKLVIALVFLGFILAAAMRPGIDALHRRGVPRSVGLLLHYLALAGVVTATSPPPLLSTGLIMFAALSAGV